MTSPDERNPDSSRPSGPDRPDQDPAPPSAPPSGEPEPGAPPPSAPRSDATAASATADAARARMPGWLPRAMVVALALFGCFLLAEWAFQRLLGLLVNVMIAFFLALAIEPAVDRMAARGMRRGLATGLVFLAILVVFGGFMVVMGSLIVGQIREVVENLPEYVNAVIVWANDVFGTDVSLGKVQENVLHSDWLRSYLQEGAGSVWGLSATVVGGLFRVLMVVLFTFYFAAEGPRMRRALCSVLPPAKQAEVLRAWEIAVAKTGGYIYSRALMALVSGIAHYVVFLVLDVPYAPALAIWVGLVSQFIPTVGTYLAGALPMLIAFTRDPWDAVWVLGFVVLYQQFENYVLQPRISARTVDIHPAVAFGSVIAGTALLGAVGALVAIPATATLQGFLGAYVKRYAVTDPRAGEEWRRERDDRGEPLLARLRRGLRR